MGCCLTRPYNPPAPPDKNRSPPLPVKETVKDVLTDTQPKPSLLDNLHGIHLPKHNDLKSCVPPLVLPDDEPEDPPSGICSRSESFVSTADENSSTGVLLRAVASKGEDRRSLGKKPPPRAQSPGSNAAVNGSARRNGRISREQSPRGRGQVRMVGGTKGDQGERSGRRSRSPATRVGRTESGRRTNPSPGRPRRGGGNREELIENPLVSLECFIFL